MKYFVLILALLISACSDTPPKSNGPMPESTGIAEARKDIAAGKLIIREQPIPAPAWYGDYHKLLLEKGIEAKAVSHNDAKLTTDDLTYNQTMMAEIEKRHGVGIVEKLRIKAEDDHKARSKQPKE